MANNSGKIRQTAIDVMKKGGLEICENARAKHHSGEYLTSGESAEEFIEHWRQVEDEIRLIAAELGE